MKKGDKVYCIKDFGIFERNTPLGTDILNYKHRDGTYKNAFFYFVKGKSYKVKSILWIAFDGWEGCVLESEKRTKKGRTTTINQEFYFSENPENHYSSPCLFKDHFVTEKEYRRMKLQDLSDLNFSEFLKKNEKMKFTIENMEPMLVYENKKKFLVNGYAFMDETGSCIKIVYSEGKRNALIQYLTDDSDELLLKYKIITNCSKVGLPRPKDRGWPALG